MRSSALDLLSPRLHLQLRRKRTTHPSPPPPPRVRSFTNAHAFRKQAQPLRSTPSLTSDPALAGGSVRLDTCRRPTSTVTKTTPNAIIRSTPRAREEEATAAPGGLLRALVVGAAASLAVTVFILAGGTGGHRQVVALALGPEGPLAEEFWDNMRRYGLYILTVSTGVLYAVFQPIVELLRNPVTAILILAVLAGGAYLLSQVLSLMFGITDFAYDYGN